MKGLKLAAVSLGLVGMLCTAWVGLASAHGFHTGTTVTLGGGKPVYQTVFAGARTIDIDNEVFGDVICAGQTVTITGVVHGDVICAGQTVNVSGTVDGDVRLAGQTVTLGAHVTGNATIGGQDFTLTSEGRVGGDMTIASSDAVFRGNIGRDLALGGNSTVIAGTIGRDIKGATNQLTLAGGARVGGNVEYTSKDSLQRAAGVVVAGTVTHHVPQHPAKSKHGAIWGFGFLWFLYWLMALLLMALVIALLFPHLLHQVTDKASPWPWKALLVGLLVSVSLPLVFVLLVVSVIGIPLAVLVLLLWLGVAMLSAPVFAYYIGRQVLRRSRQALLIMFTGVVVLVLASFIPILGFIALLASFLIGSGMVFMEAFRRTPKPNYHVNPEANK